MNVSSRALVIGSYAARMFNLPLPGVGLTKSDVDYIIGSDAAGSMLHNPPFLRQVQPLSKDHIIIHRTQGLLPVELNIAWPGSTNWELLERYGRDNDTLVYATPDVQHALKLSHRFKDTKHFEKTRAQVIAFRDIERATLDPWLYDFVNRRMKEGAKPSPKLNMGKGSFFNANVPYVWDHDSIHAAVARKLQTPAYKSFQKDGAEVMVDKAKWDNLTRQVRFNSVLEEAAVLAIERALVPTRFRLDPERTLRTALQKVATIISSGWWREFAWEHFDDIAAEGAKWDYVAAFHKGVENGVVVPYRGGNDGAMGNL